MNVPDPDRPQPTRSDGRPPHDTLPAIWSAAVADGRDRVVLATPQRRMTYGEIDALAMRCAQGLVADGVGKGDHVGILLPNGPLWVVAALAAVRIGAVVVPISTFVSGDELTWVLAHADVRHLMLVDEIAGHRCVEELVRALPGVDLAEGIVDARLPHLRRVRRLGDADDPAEAFVELIDAGATIPPAVIGALQETVHGDDDCYLLYTSGTTNLPKGVLHRHRSVATNGWWIGERQGLRPDDRSFFYYPLFFSAGCINVFVGTISHGAAMLMVPFLDADVAVDLMVRERVTALHLWPHSLDKLMHHERWSEIDVERIHAGTGPFDVWMGRPAHHGSGGVAMYGLTETCTAFSCSTSTDTVEVRTTTSGTVLPGNEVRIVDPDTRLPVGPGEVGEIFVRGRGLMRRYYKVDVEATFEPDGFLPTGDRGVIDDAGRLCFKGRATDMVKVGGVNVSPRDVELALAALDGVVEVHAFALSDPLMGEVVGVAVVTSDGRAPVGWDTHVAGLAPFKRPAEVLWVPEAALPRTATGKVLVRELKAIPFS